MCDCREHVKKLNQQVSVMRKEMKNLRQMLDGAVRAHRKHLDSVLAAVSTTGHCEGEKEQTPSPGAALEQGNIQTVPIGYVSSCFSVKTGTPRQPTICGPSRAEVQIRQSVFNNPHHALVGLEQYSHVWIIFLFHKNGHQSYKAKVKPPRLNGQRVGVYSTRSPHRPNALGLTLAKLDKIEGDTVHLSDIDMIAGTPVLDIKPYIPEYDSPDRRMSVDTETRDSVMASVVPLSEETNAMNVQKHSDSEADAELNIKAEGIGVECKAGGLQSKPTSENDHSLNPFLPKHLHDVLEEVEAYVNQDDAVRLRCDDEKVWSSAEAKPSESVAAPCFGEESSATIAAWIQQPPVASLDVRFTSHAEKQLAEFLPTHLSGPGDSDRPRFKFLRSPVEAAAAIRGVLSADPRSVYRRTRCRDRLFFFTLDTAHITCWFGPGFAEVVQVRPAS